jgi:asparagine synthase (glutamine-hydrolysing)
MCGIAGLWGEGVRDRVAWMTSLLAHRGPDDEGVWMSQSAPIALGNRRLKILDLSMAGHQPMRSPDGRLVLTFNGEIYNQGDLRSELESLGHVFRSHSDTEVLLAALAQWGTMALQRLNGMFAFALWNETTKTLLLARDRLGIKPLYYTIRENALAFSSEIRSLLGSGLIKPELDRESLRSYLRLLWVPEPKTLFRDIWKLMPGTYLSWDGIRVQNVRYWDVPEQVESPCENSAEGLRFVLQRAIKGQLSADVPVGAFLSGGLDSTAVAALAMSSRSRDVRSYTIGFSSEDLKQEGALDDLGYARLAAKRLGLRHEEIILAPKVVDLLPKMVRHLEDPVADPAAINCYLICQAARETSTVLLSGTGADELFGGYYKYVGTNLGEMYHRISGPIGKNVVEPLARKLPITVGGTGIRSFRRAKRFLRHAGLPAFDRFAGFSCYYDAEELYELLGLDPIDAREDLYAGIEPLKEAWDHRSSGDLVGRMTYVDLKLYLPGLALAYMDKASMAASVEVRVPLLDDEVVEYAARLPGVAKVNGTRTKVALRAAMNGLVPSEIINRPKAPFAAPVRAWLRRDLAPLIEELLSPRRLTDRGLVSPQVVHRLIREHRKGTEDHSLQIWAFLTLEIWMQEFIDHASQFSIPEGELAAPVEVAGGTL